MPRDACGDRLPERFLDVGAATLRVTRCFQFSQGHLIAGVPDYAPMLRPRIRNPSSPDRDVLRQPGQQNTQSAHRADSAGAEVTRRLR